MTNTLTLKQREFVKEYIKSSGNGTQAALASYDTDDPNTAHSIASENLRKPTIKRAIELALERVGLTDDYVSELLREATISGLGKKASNSDALRGLEMMLKLKGAFPSPVNRSAHVRVDYRQNLEKMSYAELKKEAEKQKQQLQRLLTDIG